MNDFAALFPAIWARRTQIYKESQLVSKIVGNYRLEDELKVGDRVNRPIYSDLTVNDYSRSQEVNLQDLSSTPERLIVDREKEISFYIDSLDEIQSKYNDQNNFATRAAYVLSREVDGTFFKEALNATYTWNTTAGAPAGGFTKATADDYVSGLEAYMFQNEIEFDRRRDLILPAKEAGYIEARRLAGFKVQDETIENGYVFAGRPVPYMNYMTYISNFLPQTSLFGTANFAANDTVIIAGVTFTFKATPALWNDIAVGADIPTSLANANLVLSGKGAIQPTASADIKSLAKVVATGAFFKQDSATTPNTVLVNSGDVTIGGSDFVAGSRTIYGLAERTGSIDIVIQRQATPQINKAPKQLGYNTLLVNLYGVKAFQDGRDRMVMLPFPRV